MLIFLGYTLFAGIISSYLKHRLNPVKPRLSIILCRSFS